MNANKPYETEVKSSQLTENDAVESNVLLSSPSDVIHNITCFLSYGSIFTLLDVSKIVRTTFEVKLKEIYERFLPFSNNRSFKDAIVDDAITIDDLSLFQYFERIGIKASLPFIGLQCAKKGSINILKYVPDLSSVILNRRLNQAFCKEAVENGQLEALEWAKDNDYLPKDLSGSLCGSAAAVGNLHILQWLIKNKCFWDSNTVMAAAVAGHLHILEWFYLAYFNPETKQYRFLWTETTCAKVASHGQLRVLQWLRKKGCPWDERTYHFAISAGKVELSQWAVKNGCPSHESESFDDEDSLDYWDRLGRIITK